MKKTAMLLVLAGALGMMSQAQATLINRGNGIVYDDVLNITWLADANYAKTSGYDADGRMDWDSAMTWADNLVYGGYNDWRLPTTQQPDSTCWGQFGGYSDGYNCTGSEMGYMFYTNLGGIGGTAISVTHNANYSLFSHIQDDVPWDIYWSGTGVSPGDLFAWNFRFGGGSQNVDGKVFDRYAWAVRPGDVDVVPEPATVLLFGVGAVGIGLGRRWGRW